eukprot:TRINITY_DN227_c0_g1_i13.p1 TRINITY_DN227_c0_g1~~TRINITY_DN227_c0_g1_i13.p1  ORF type:complete len:432 (+),score=95.81 TRINITY_DN227_c0_g1_i13:35-1330(+)
MEAQATQHRDQEKPKLKSTTTVTKGKDDEKSSKEEQKTSKEEANLVKVKGLEPLVSSAQKKAEPVPIQMVQSDNKELESKQAKDTLNSKAKLKVMSAFRKFSMALKLDLTFSEHTDRVMSVCMVDDERCCSASYDNTIQLWNIKTGKCECTFTGHTETVRACVYLPSLECIASCSDDGSIRFWKVSSGEQMHVIENAHTGRVIQLLSLDNGRRLVSGGYLDDSAIKVWETTNEYKCLQTLRGHSNGILSLCILKKNGWLASGSYDKNVKLWDLSKGECVATLTGHTSEVYGLAQLPHQDNLFVSCSYDQTLKIWDVTSLRCMLTIQCNGSLDSMCALSNNNTMDDDDNNEQKQKHDYVAVGGDYKGSILIYDLNAEALQQAEKEKKTIQPLQTLSGHSSWVNALCYSSQSNQLVSGSYDITCKVWSAADSV